MFNEIWKKIENIINITREVNTELKSILGDDNYIELVSEYNVEKLVEKAKETLIKTTIKKVLEKYNVRNLHVSDEDIKKLFEKEGFNEKEIEKYIYEKYVKDADEKAYNEILSTVKYLLPYKVNRKLTIDDLVKGRKLILKIYWMFGRVNYQSMLAIYNLDKLIKIVFSKVKPSKVTVEKGIADVIRMFEPTYTEEYKQARKYVYNTQIIEGFRIYKNGKFTITFKTEKHAKKLARILLN